MSKYGDRVPGVWFHHIGDGTLYIAAPINGNLDRTFDTQPVPVKQWSHLEISQQLINDIYIYSIKLNGLKVFSEQNNQAQVFENVKVFASDPWYPAQDGSIKDLFIINGDSGEIAKSVNNLSAYK